MTLAKRPKSLPNKQFGETHPLAKLSDDDVKEILEGANHGDKQVEMAALFGVSQAQISRIVNRKQRRWVTAGK